jgi:glycosyltransferase involved in cell wall biosynthesis
MSCRSVLLCTEGTYPYVEGGVSTWCHQLVGALEDVDFTIYAVTGTADVTRRFDPPANVRGLMHVPLWGSEEPAIDVAGHLSFARIQGRKRATRSSRVEEEFVPLLRRFLQGVEGGEGVDLDEHGAVLHAMWRWFADHDWKDTWRSAPVWQAFRHEALAAYRDRPEDLLPHEHPSLYDVTTALRWLYYFMMPLNTPVPEADVVHTTIAAFAGIPGIVAKIERDTPFVVTDHGVWVRERYIAVSAGPFTPFAKRFLMNLASHLSRLNYHFADVVSPVTNFNRRWEIPYAAHPDRIEPIYNGVDPATFVPGPKPPATEGRPVVVAAARVFPLKDVETMIRSAAVAREAFPDVQYRLYGALDADPEYVEHCRSVVTELALEETFLFLGHHHTPAELYLEGDLCVLSSISEAFPYTVLEAMACARPVVATDVGGVREALEGFGIVVPPRDPEALGRAVVRLLEDDELRLELGRHARAEVLAKYRISESVSAYRRLYDRLAAASPPARGSHVTTPLELAA